MRGPALLLLMAACGSVTADDDDDADATPAADAAALLPDAPGPRCSPTAPFGPATRLDSLNTTLTSEDSPFLTADELTIYFSSTRDGGPGDWDLYRSTRTSIDDDFPEPELVPGAINTAAMERRPVITADGHLYAYTFGSTYDVSVSQRTGDSYGALVPVSALNTGTDAGDPFVLSDHSAIYFAADQDLYRAARPGGAFAEPEPLTGFQLGAGDQEASPVVTPDERTLYFQSSRAGGQGSWDIWVTHRSVPDIGFEQPVNVAALNTGAIEVPHWVSADDCVLYFTRNVSAAGTDYDMFYAVRGQE